MGTSQDVVGYTAVMNSSPWNVAMHLGSSWDVCWC